ncbi:hypothetical protein [Chitinilyticum litopenaei]|uniref:hypothetical protein n=1 Tax=Chitinilyticum litopenaei TaxID=1121276 RepID=UPI00041C6356|nr:hypothetical protein [Chitinilyticum litopenaei]
MAHSKLVAALLASVSLAAFAASPSVSCPMQKMPQGDVGKAQFLQQAGEHFDQMDGDRNGVVSAAERKAWREQVRAQCPNPRGGKHGGGPKHGDMPKMQQDMTRADALQRAEAHFDRMDASKDGVVSDAERQAWREQMRERKMQRRASAPQAQ